LASELGVEVVDRRIPVRVLNLLWHRAEWPPVEVVAGQFDVVHAAHPLLLPTRCAAQVVTIHDLFFLSDPDRTTAEIRRDYPALAGSHARRAHAVITSTDHGKRLVGDRLGVARDRIYTCGPGAPTWRTLGRRPNVPRGGYLLFVGTLEPRKNLGVLLDAYSILLSTQREVPPLLIAGRSTREAAPLLARTVEPPLAGHVRVLGYVSDAERENLYAGARALILPSLDEGFGLPVLEAMSAGVPVVASNRGALPEVVGTGGMLIDPTRPADLAAALAPLIADDTVAEQWGAAGLERARAFSWSAAAQTLRLAYTEAVARRRNPESPPR
jgi:glycosyltransferase involved in cell wall biosynthesis